MLTKLTHNWHKNIRPGSLDMLTKPSLIMGNVVKSQLQNLIENSPLAKQEKK